MTSKPEWWQTGGKLTVPGVRATFRSQRQVQTGCGHSAGMAPTPIIFNTRFASKRKRTTAEVWAPDSEKGVEDFDV